ncbi:hypothetical protein BIU97_12540 [Curtobacterium sp. MCBA15_009]|uniref:alpha/beta hydrolase n=1 Tax=Curtobacterium sp. MCBA15_009 TaxID=1898737 RepID=UPI0008DC7A4A|nr:alpha/beta hydrolase [Curtobacterium sp. MCBA15_009]OII09347.1 hypothetical protein BIU97_12540 [Curtobacterium sp. MCBA15_009]
MLLVAAALLTASMHSLGVVEAPNVPPTPPPTAVVAVAPVAAVTADDAATAHGRRLLDDLVALAPADLRHAQDDARLAATVQDDPPSAVDVIRWWAGLGDGERQYVEQTAPAVVGNLEGVPYAVRDRANRTTLDRALAAADGDDGSATARMLDRVRESLVTQPGDPQRFLVTLDTRGPGRAAIAIGDLDTATDVTLVVPGMFFTVSGQMVDFTATANDLAAEQASLAPLAVRGDRSSVAVVAWMGYRTPDLSNILSLQLAETGADRLERAVDGLRHVRDGDQPRLNLVAHSYGSTTAMMALTSGRMSADTLTVLGSPGSDVRSASDLAVPHGQVFVGSAHSDPIAGSGYFGTDPGEASFGATVLDLRAATHGQGTTAVFRRPVGHNDYLKPGTASLHDVALIGVGRGDVVRDQAQGGSSRGDGVTVSPDVFLVRPQDLQPRD